MLDPLTGLMNRRELPNRFAALRQRARDVSGPIALLAVDIDHFKEVNDRYGHDRGDAVLRELAGVMRASLRTFDEVYRIGGEEFLLVAGGASEEEACVLAERLRNAVENARPAGVRITISVGVVSRPSDTGDANCDELMRVADTALYAAKHSGRNRVHAAA